MNRKDTERAITVMQAYVDGAEIEAICDSGTNLDQRWHYITESIWNWSNGDYRIKPKPREFVLELNTDGTVRNTLEKGEEPWFDKAVHIHVKEVLN